MFRKLLAAGVSLLCSGCATVQSERHNVYSSKAQGGLTYFLPMRLVKVTALRERLDPASIKSALDKKTAEQATAKQAADAASAASKAQEAVIAALPAGTDADTVKRETSTLQVLKAKESIATTESANLKTVVGGLQQLLQTAQVSPTNTCTYSVKIELQPAQADDGARYVAKPFHNWFRDDQTKLAVSDAQLLTSTNVVAADRTADILTELGGANAALNFNAPGSAIPSPDPIPCDAGQNKFVRLIDPALENPFDAQGLNDKLKASGFPIGIEFTNTRGDELVSPTHSTPAPDESVDEQSVVSVPATPPKPPVWRAPLGSADGVYYRSPMPVRLTVYQCAMDATVCNSDEGKPIDAAVIMVPQAGPVSFIPMGSSAFVKTVNDVQFDNGTIKSWNAEQPSEVLEIVRLPVKILSAAASVIGQIFTFRVNYDNQSDSLAKAQLSEMKASAQMQLLNSCIKAAGEDAVALKACLAN